jgi:hypothetical protein
MIAVFVEFDGVDGVIARKIAGEFRGLFEGMPGLRWKFFTVDEAASRARNVYVWRSEEAARQFFSEEMIEKIAGTYGVRPTIDYAELVGVVDNAA